MDNSGGLPGNFGFLSPQLLQVTEPGFQISSLFGLVMVLVLVAMTAFFVAAEFTLVSVRETRISQLVSQGNKSAMLVEKARSQLDNYIAAVQLGVTLASITLGVVGEPAVESLIEPPLKAIFGPGLGSELLNGLSIALAFLIITTLEIILGELVPKSAALQRTEGIVLFVIRPLNLFLRIFWPFIWLLNRMGRVVLRLFRLNPTIEHSQVHSAEELEILVLQSHKAGVLDAQEESLLRKVFQFDDKVVRQIMMPRTEIMGIPEQTTLDELIDITSREGFTRFPVYQESLDQIIAVVHVKDLFPLIRIELQQLRNRLTTSQPVNAVITSNSATLVHNQVDLKEVMRPVIKVPENVHVADILSQMRLQQIHMAVVIDEYGGTSGIVTLEDVLEELIGEVEDEFDTKAAGEPGEVELQPDGAVIVSGLVTPDIVEEVVGLIIPVEERRGFDTIGGYLLGALGHIPVAGEQLEVGHKYRLVVVQMDGLRIDRILIEPIT